MGIFDLFKPQKKYELNFMFNSEDHLRYENGIHVSGPHGGAPRAIKVEPNINGREGYTVTLYNTDGQYSVQMAPKQMKIIHQENNKVVLRGFGLDNMGAPFADYGLSILYNDEKIEKCILHMHDRKVDIHYMKSNNNGFEDVDQFLNLFRTLSTEEKMELATKTDYLNNRGVDYYEAGDINMAIYYYQKALEIYPINDDALKNLIICYKESNELSKMTESQKKLNYLRKIGI